MARIRLRVEDEMGQALGQERVYELGSELRTLAEIEGAVEEFRCAALVELEADFLAAAQTARIAVEKKRSLTLPWADAGDVEDFAREFRVSGTALYACRRPRGGALFRVERRIRGRL